MGQPTHCYDAEKVENEFSLEFLDQEHEFETLLDSKIKLKDKDLVFIQDNNVINLAGVVGSKNTACNKDTKSVIVECAYFNPEIIIGKSIKYDIKSEAAHKFERGVDPCCHEMVLRRFLSIVNDHADIKNIEMISNNYDSHRFSQIPFNLERINKILGSNIDALEFEEYLLKLNFTIENNKIVAPSYRADIKTENDIAEEIARVVGYNNIKAQPFKILSLADKEITSRALELNIKNLLIEHGFLEVINNPFVEYHSKNSIKVDNPLDSNKNNIRISLQQSLVDNLLYNERRQQDSVKLFEISDMYYLSDGVIENKRMLGMICSGRVGKNYEFFKNIDKKYLVNILNKVSTEMYFDLKNINRDDLESKLNNEIIYVEIDLNSQKNINTKLIDQNKDNSDSNFIKYEPISLFPSSFRDLSFAVKDKDSYNNLQKFLLNYKSDIIKEIFVFDFFYNEQKEEIKIGFRFVFQSKISTITDTQVNMIMDEIINETSSMESVTIPGLIN